MTERIIIHAELETDQTVAALILYDGMNWILRIVEPPTTETMIKLRRGLQALAHQLKESGF